MIHAFRGLAGGEWGKMPHPFFSLKTMAQAQTRQQVPEPRQILMATSDRTVVCTQGHEHVPLPVSACVSA